jgi:N-acetylmuramoyl-L-alanine amidase
VTTPSVHLSRGTKSEAVRDLRHRLEAAGFPGGGDDPDEFGPDTEAAVRGFQASRGLRVDGICGRQTWATLVESGWALGDRLLYHRRPMLRGDDVAELQRSLNTLGFDAGKDDGIFGPATEAALKEFQRNAGLTVDGICGPDTEAALVRLSRGAEGSVARVRERESMRDEPPGLGGRRVFLAVEPGLEPLAQVVRSAMAHAGAHVVLEPAPADQSSLATEANAYGADLVVLLRLGAEASECAFYASKSFRSERGHRMAECISEALAKVLAVPVEGPVGRTYPLLRETKAPAVVCEPVAAGDVDAVNALVTRAGDVGRAIAEGVRRAVEEPPADAAGTG